MAVSTLFDVSEQYNNLTVSAESLTRCFHCSGKLEDNQLMPFNHSFCMRCMTGMMTSNSSLCTEEPTANDLTLINQSPLFDFFSSQQRRMSQKSRSRTSSFEDTVSVLSSSPNHISLSPPPPPSSILAGTPLENVQVPISINNHSPLSLLMRESLSLPDPHITYCNHCFSEEQFPFRCETCKDTLCPPCASTHTGNAGMRDHVVRCPNNASVSTFSPAVGSERHSPLRQTVDERIPSPTTSILSRETLKRVILCGHDNSGVVYYCANCTSVMCFDCMVRHEAHKVFPLQGSQDAFKCIFKEMMGDVEMYVTEVSASYNKAKCLLDRLSIRAVSVSVELHEEFRKISEALQVRLKILKEKLAMVEHLKKKTLYDQMQYLSETKNKLMLAQAALKNSFESQNISELVDIHCRLKMDLKTLDTIDAYLQPHEEDVLSFEAPTSSVCSRLSNLGAFNSMGYAKTTYAFGVNTDTAIVGTHCSISVQSVDHSGEKRNVGGDEIKAILWYQDNKKKPLEVQDHGTGLYTVFFFPCDFSRHTISITLRNQRIRNTPIVPEIKRLRQYHTLKYPLATYGTEVVDEISVKRPWGVHCDRDGFIYLSDRSNNCIHVLNPDGSLRRRFGSKGSAPGKLNRPAGITVDVNRRVIVADKDNHRIQLFTFDGNFLFTFGSRGNNPGEFFYPWGIDSDRLGRIVVTDTRNHRIQLFDSNGTYLNSLGSSSVVLWREMDNPRGVCFGPQGQIFVTDFNNHQIAIIDKDLNKTTIRNFGKFGDGDGEFNRPQGVLVDPYGYLLVVDTRNHRINVFSLTGTYICSFGLGEGNKQIMERPVDIAYSPNGYIFVVDFGNDCVRKF